MVLRRNKNIEAKQSGRNEDKRECGQSRLMKEARGEARVIS
jgi:hypothetical protein